MARKYKTSSYTGTVGGALDGAKSEIESLKEEMESWRDGMEDTMSHMPKYDEVSECCDNLETVVDQLESVELPEDLLDETATYSELSPYGRKPQPRWMRLSNAQSMAEAVKDAIQARMDAQTEAEGDEEDEDEDSETDADATDWQEQYDYLEEATGAMEGVDFPGMY